MTGQLHEHPPWTRYPAENPVVFTSNGRSRKGRLRDISASGAAFELENVDSDDDRGMLTVDDLGVYETQVIRDMDDGFAVMLNLDEGEQATLQDELADYFYQEDQGFD